MRKTVVSVSALCLAFAATSVRSAGNDELWEMTTTMKMQGMAMPAMKSKMCIAKDGAYNPDADKKDKNCTTTDYKVSGNTVKWAMKCTGKNAMTGTGEMTKTADAMKGTFNMQAEGMAMVQVMDGKRIGTCDAVAQKKAVNEAVADINATSAAETKRSCEDTARQIARNGGEKATGDTFKGKGQCAAQRESLCKQLRSRAGTYAGFAAYNNHRDALRAANQPSGGALADCGIDLEKQRPDLCKRAVGDKNYRFIGGFCPVEAAQLNAKECAGFGRDYTADLARPNAGVCRALRSKAAGYEDADTKANAEADRAAATESAKESEKNQAKSGGAMDKLKKTFGF
jgi:hypothetical protein